MSAEVLILRHSHKKSNTCLEIINVYGLFLKKINL